VSVIDLRSDTQTRPTHAMREVMANAEVGDDVYGEDPSVNRLQEQAAELVGKEAALFLPSGSMANQASLRALTQPGDLVLAGADAHVLKFEAGAAAALSGLQIHTLGRDGFFEGADVRAVMTPDDSHFPRTRAVCVENTHNFSGGRVFPYDRMKDAAESARELGLALHLDGARLFNAVVASGIAAAAWAEPFDTVAFCFSKGLGAPVGSVVCGSAETIRSVHRARKLLGGGMRQAGILAAAASYALDHHISRLALDHLHAGRLASGLAKIGFRVDPEPETNMVMFEVANPSAFLRATRARELLIDPIAHGRFRAVTHLDVTSDDIETALGIIEEIAGTGVR
jgi:threonine aldolase